MKRSLRSVILSPLIAVIAFYILLEDFLEATVFPLVRYLSSFNFLQTIEAFLRRRNPYTLFVIYASKFAVFSSIKLVSLYLISTGNLFGAPLLVTGELSGALLTVWYAKIALPMLLTLPWFAKGYEKIMRCKNWLIDKLQQMALYHYATIVVSRVRQAIRMLKEQIAMDKSSRCFDKRFNFFRAIYRFVRKQ